MPKLKYNCSYCGKENNKSIKRNKNNVYFCNLSCFGSFNRQEQLNNKNVNVSDSLKTCSNCQEEKNIDLFFNQSDRNNNSSQCKKCISTRQVLRWIHIKLKAIKYKGGKCTNCGYSKHYAALQFHHTNPSEKEFNFTKLRLKCWNDIKLELDKCELLCANCHPIEHSKYKTNEDIPEYSFNEKNPIFEI